MIHTFSYYGGKQRHLPFILRNLPIAGPNNQHFIDVFGGSAVVVLNVNYPLRTYNDKNDQLVNFFRMLREKPDELLRVIELTPYARTEYLESTKALPDDFNGDENIEKARRFLVSLFFSFNHVLKDSKTWAVNRNNSGGAPSRLWAKTLLKCLQDVIPDLKLIQIENIDGFDLIPKVDNKNNVIYLDPPYPRDTRKMLDSYGKYELSNADQKRLIAVLKKVRHAKVALSSYPNKLYDSLNWNRVSYETTMQQTHEKRVEALYLNYDPPGRLF